ncbi:MAG: Asp-tRNA(Asn)/Glu-tRNA(Gln) amidotransferase subunit GatB [Oscillospiraceae bacterium]|nr:Asp-tRNA(Asn)/Glu-tRNA(Gln) amidotransferase subunit GatB [Oscillospiraceae bacterium]
MKWEVVMGLEVHVELATKTKIFCSCTTEFGGEPNTHCCPVCTGMPGTLPVFNRQVLEYAVRAGLALNCDITRYNKFDRKNYFYPDLPKAYQISQLYLPFAQNGHVDLKLKSGKTSQIRIHEIHMEEDAGKLVHSAYDDSTYLDYNRCGIPLIEIVSEPDFREAEEVTAYLSKLKSVFEYLGISDCRMEEGSMRADVNLSVRPEGSTEFGTRTEMKNINSLRAIERAIAYESKRQIELIEDGGKVVQETRRWDDAKGESYAMRSKENAQDYRYFPEPDIPPLSISEEEIQHYIDITPEFADAKAERFMKDFGLSEEDADIIAASKNLAYIFEETVKLCDSPSEVRFWIMSQVLYYANEKNLDLEKLSISPEKFAEFVKFITGGKVTRQAGKQVFEQLMFGGTDFDVAAYIKENELEAVEDTGLIDSTVKAVIDANPKAVEQYKGGGTKIMGFFVGQVMKQLKGKADPAAVNKAVLDALEKL